MHARNTIALAGILATVLTAAPALQAAPQAEQRGAQERPSLIDLEFGGGTAVDYLEAVRRAAGGELNLIIAPDVRLVRLQPITLKRVDVMAAVSLLDDMQQDLNDRWIELEVGRKGGAGGRTGLPIFVVDAEIVVKNPRQSPKASEVWSVKGTLERGMKPEDLLTAIETALELFGDEYDPVNVRFHGETGLVLARGYHEQIAIIQTVIDELARPSSVDEHEAAMERLRAEAEHEIRMREQQMAQIEQDRQQQMARMDLDHQQQIARMEREYEQQIQGALQNLRDVQQAMQSQLRNRDAEIQELELELSRLRARLEEEGE
jgi:hypothetical protein